MRAVGEPVYLLKCQDPRKETRSGAFGQPASSHKISECHREVRNIFGFGVSASKHITKYQCKVTQAKPDPERT